MKHVSAVPTDILVRYLEQHQQPIPPTNTALYRTAGDLLRSGYVPRTLPELADYSTAYELYTQGVTVPQSTLTTVMTVPFTALQEYITLFKLPSQPELEVRGRIADVLYYLNVLTPVVAGSIPALDNLTADVIGEFSERLSCVDIAAFCSSSTAGRTACLATGVISRQTVERTGLDLLSLPATVGNPSLAVQLLARFCQWGTNNRINVATVVAPQADGTTGAYRAVAAIVHQELRLRQPDGLVAVNYTRPVAQLSHEGLTHQSYVLTTNGEVYRLLITAQETYAVAEEFIAADIVALVSGPTFTVVQSAPGVLTLVDYGPILTTAGPMVQLVAATNYVLGLSERGQVWAVHVPTKSEIQYRNAGQQQRFRGLFGSSGPNLDFFALVDYNGGVYVGHELYLGMIGGFTAITTTPQFVSAEPIRKLVIGHNVAALLLDNGSINIVLFDREDYWYRFHNAGPLAWTLPVGAVVKDIYCQTPRRSPLRTILYLVVTVAGVDEVRPVIPRIA